MVTTKRNNIKTQFLQKLRSFIVLEICLVWFHGSFHPLRLQGDFKPHTPYIALFNLSLQFIRNTNQCRIRTRHKITCEKIFIAILYMITIKLLITSILDNGYKMFNSIVVRKQDQRPNMTTMAQFITSHTVSLNSSLRIVATNGTSFEALLSIL